jgi:DNA adenine methylase
MPELRAPRAPILKWAGGKSRLLPELLSRLPARWDRYFEPFAGGAALFFALAPQRAVLGDANQDLMDVYRAVGANCSAVIRGLRSHQKLHSATYFYETRALWNTQRSKWTLPKRAAAFVYLNKTCFNGLWRVNRAGEFNVPMGRYADPPICVPEALRAVHSVLARAELHSADYRETIRDARPGDLVYLDPPYYPTSSTANFTSYTLGAFTDENQRELADIARRLASRGCHVMVSNSDTPFIHDLYQGFRVSRVRCPRSINSATSRRGEVNELIIESANRTSARSSAPTRRG